MKSLEVEGSFGYLSRFSPIKEALFFPWKTPEVKNREDEVGLCYLSSENSHDPIRKIMNLCSGSSYRAQDRRCSYSGKGMIGVIESNPLDISEVLLSYFERGLAAPRRGVIDKDERLVKLVGVVVVSNEEGVLLVPRGEGERILPGAATVSVMESLALVDIAPLFAAYGQYMMFTGDPPRELFPDNDPPFRGWEDQVVKNIIFRGAREESLELQPDRLEFLGVVGGAKDLGLTWHYRASSEELEILKTLHLGIVIKFGPEDYYASLKRLNLKPDGWTEAILRFMEKRY